MLFASFALKLFKFSKIIFRGSNPVNLSEGIGKSIWDRREKLNQSNQVNEWVKMIKNIPNCKALLDYWNQKEVNFGPFGNEKVKILENSFKAILENMFCGGNKLLLYVIENKDLPKWKADYERYEKLKKFKRYELYPDPLVRKFIEDNIDLNLTDEQLLHLHANQIPQLIEIKKEMKIGMNMLFEAKEQIYKSLMLNHVFKKKFMNTWIWKEQLIHQLNYIKEVDIKVGYEQIFNVQKEEIEVERSIEIMDQEIYGQVTSCYQKSKDYSKLPKFVSEKFNMTIQRWI